MSGHEVLVEVRIPVTATLIAAGAVATSDFQYSHLDPVRAREAGTPDVIMNIHTLTGLLASYVLRQASPGAELTALDVRLGLPVHPGDVLTFAGQATEPGVYTLQLTSDRGVHARGRAVIEKA